MNSDNDGNPNRRSFFATSSTEFALPFGSARPTTSSNNDTASSVGSSDQGFFQSASSIPISIPSSPSLTFTSNQPGSSRNVPLLSLAAGMSSSPSKLASSGTGLGIGNLPSPSAREHVNPLAQPQLSTFPGQPRSPTLSLAGEGWPPPPFTSFPSASSSSSSAGVTTPSALLRRTAGMNSPGFAIASPARFRRASMLGREITPFHLDNDDDEEDQASNVPTSTTARQSANMRGDANQNPDDGDDEMMQVEDDDPARSRAPSTPVMGPPQSLFGTPSTPPPSSSHLPHTRQSLATSALARASASDSGQDSSSSTGGGNSRSGSAMGESAGLSRTVPRSPSVGPSTGSPLGHGGNRSRSSSLLSSNVVRKAVTRRGNLLPRDRSVLRVAASLHDETKPEDSEIASEAKLQKRLGGEATLPRTPRFGPNSSGISSGALGGSSSAMRASKSPFFGPTSGGGNGAGFSRRKYMWDDDVDDIRGVFTADGLDDGDSSALSSEEEEMMMYYSRTNSLSDEEDELRSRMNDDTDMMQDATSTSVGGGSDNNNNGPTDGTGAGVSGAMSTSIGSNAGGAGQAAGANAGSLPKRKNNSLWMGFRDKGNAHKWSPGGPGSAATGAGGSGVFNGERAAWRRAGGTSAASGMGMDVDTSPRVLGAAGGARLSKRKTMGDDRYEPYKRRAVSPMNLGSSLGTTPTNASFAAAAAAAAAAANSSTAAQAGGGGGSNSPLMMPISSPSGSMLYRGIHHHHYHAYASRYSTSPTISRPCTPVNSTSAAGAASAGAGPGGVVSMGSFSPAASGSGPGYGSGALGLSISANNPQSVESRVQLEQQQENEALMDQRVGMLGLS